MRAAARYVGPGLTARAGITQKPSPDQPAPTPAPVPATEEPTPNIPSTPDLAPSLATLNTRLATLYGALPPRTALILFTGHGDPRAMSALAARKGAFEQALRLGVPADDIEEGKRWTAADGRRLEEEVEVCRRGMLFLSVKG